MCNFDNFKSETNEYLKRNVSLAKTNAAFFPFMLLLIGLSTLLTIYIGGKESIAGNITTGNIAEFIIYVNMLTWPMASIGWVTSIIQRAAASQKRINEFLNTKSELNTEGGITNKINGKINFNNVSFIYPESGVKALNNITFNIEIGQSVALVGRVGSGKSTIINLISRMYEPSEGTIKFDDITINKLNLANLRSEISIVPQDSLLFSDTIFNNIAMGLKKEPSTNEIEIVAKKAAIHENILSFPKKYQTIVGERGVTLSGGQKQRISIARALIKPYSVLILDDCFSSLDNKTENKIINRILKSKTKKTTIISSHRLSTVKHVDKIIVLDSGKIVETGTHSELLKKFGVYYEIYNQQISQ